jgi:hypothetical protein
MAPGRRNLSGMVVCGIAILLAVAWAATAFPGHSHSALKSDFCAVCSASEAPAAAPASGVAVLPPVAAADTIDQLTVGRSERLRYASIRLRAPPSA